MARMVATAAQPGSTHRFRKHHRAAERSPTLVQLPTHQKFCRVRNETHNLGARAGFVGFLSGLKNWPLTWQPLCCRNYETTERVYYHVSTILFDWYNALGLSINAEPMTRTQSISRSGRSFWAFDVALGVLLKHMIDIAESIQDSPNSVWLTEQASWWRDVAGVGNTVWRSRTSGLRTSSIVSLGSLRQPAAQYLRVDQYPQRRLKHGQY
jgi:hypothetical protein